MYELTPNQNPEQIARDKIDAMLAASGWAVQDKNRIDHSAAEGIAVREYQTDIGLADYVLFVGGKPVGIIEAKKETEVHRISVVEEQSAGYAKAKLKWCSNDEPLPFIYESTGMLTRFRDERDPKPRSREVFAFRRSELAVQERNVKVFPKHTLLGAMYGERKTKGKCSELLIDTATNQAVATLIHMNSAKLIKHFLHWFMQKNYDNIRMKALGGAQPNLNLDIIKNKIVPLTPQKEIKRVVNEIETRFSEADAMEKAIDANLQKAERLRQGILKQEFEGKLVL